MFENQEELKKFIIWCKSQKLKVFKNEDIQFELSDLAFISDYDEPKKVKTDLNLYDSKTLAETDPDSPQEDEDLLYWSTR